MASESKGCIPLLEVLKAVNSVETVLSDFYRKTAHRVFGDEGVALFDELAVKKTRAATVVADVCEKAACGAELLNQPTQEDLNFLSTLTQSAFFKPVGNLDDLTHPSLDSNHLVDNALRLERDLMLFYMKFFHASCASQRAVFSELLKLAQADVTALSNLRLKLKRGA